MAKSRKHKVDFTGVEAFNKPAEGKHKAKISKVEETTSQGGNDMFKVTFEVVAGSEFPEDLSAYDMIIQCGACVVNRKLVQNRIVKAKKQQVPISNYGITMAFLNGILDKICF